MMIRTALLSGLVSMALFLPEGMAADPPKAQVVSKKHISGQPKCSQHMEAMIRRHGYRMVDSSFPAGQVALKVETWSDCRLTRVERNYVCNARASVSRGGVSSGSTCGSRFNAEGMSISGWGAALDEACRKLTQQIENTLGHVGAKSLPTEPQQVPVSKTSHLELLVTWEGELDPMPLLPLTRFFTKSGFEAGLAQSGEGSYLYALDLTDPPELHDGPPVETEESVGTVDMDEEDGTLRMAPKRQT